MEMIRFIIVVIFSVLWLVSSIPCRKKTKIIQKFHRTGEAIAADNLIQKYEKEHQVFYKKEIKNGNLLEWPALNNKNLTNFCGQYLQLSIPRRKIDGVIAKKIMSTLHYENENMTITSEVVVVLCKVMNKQHKYIYYMTRAPNPNCVYALKSTGNWSNFILTIINRKCDFEDKPLINKALKPGRTEIIYKMHRFTGQPIAKDKYLLQYELEHQDLLKSEQNNENLINWPYAVLHPNLDSYCYQYLGESAPSRNRKGVEGIYKTEKLCYQKLNTTKYVKVTTVACRLAHLSKVRYHISRAPEKNCVYALLRQSYNSYTPMRIIFKHCDFEELSDQQVILQNHGIKENVIPKTEVKEEIFDALETLKLFPYD